MSKPVYYFIPHQDDEVLSFGASILAHTESGQDVKVIFCSDGSKSCVRNKLANGLICSTHGETHKIALTEEQFTDARDKEAIASCKQLGVKESNIHFAPIRCVDGQMTVADVKHIMRKYMELAPGAKVKTFTPYGKSTMHRDHKAMGQAALELYNEGLITDMRFYVEPYEVENFNKDNVVTARVETTKANDKLVKALDEYKLWDLSLGRYSIGYHSVGSYFEDMKIEKKNYVHAPVN